MIFLSNIQNMTLSRSMSLPDQLPRLTKNTAIYIPTPYKEDFKKISNILHNQETNFRVRGCNSLYIPKVLKFKAGIKTLVYRNSNYPATEKEYSSAGFNNVTYMKGMLKDYNCILNYTPITELMLGPKITHTSSSNIKIWSDILSSVELIHEKKYILFTPINMKRNIKNSSIIKASSYKVKDIYVSFLYNLIYNYNDFTTLLRNTGFNVIITDNKFTFRIDFNHPDFNTEFPDKDSFISRYFSNMRKMRFGLSVEDENTNLEENIPIIEESNNVTDYDDEVVTTTMKLVDKIKSQDVTKEEQLDVVTDEVINSMQDTSNPNIRGRQTVSNKKQEEIRNRAKVVKEVVDSSRKNIRVPQRLETVEKRQNKIKEKNLEEVLARLDNIAQSIIEPDIISNNKTSFGKFSINKLEEQYEEIAKKDRIEIAEKFNRTAVPLYLTKYKEEKDYKSKDTYTKKVQMTFESPNSSEEKHSFTVKVPELRDGKFLHINGSDKVMIRQKIALPIIRLEDNVVFTTYYKKMFIDLSTGNLSKGVAKIKKYIRFIRKSFTQNYLKKFFSFVPAYFTAKKMNIYGAELLEVSRYLSHCIVDDDNFFRLDNNKLIAKIDGKSYTASKHDDLVLDENGDTYSVIQILDGVFQKMGLQDKKLLDPWEKIINTKASDNISFSRAKVMGVKLPLIFLVLHSLDEDLLTVLDILKKDYNLSYEITPLDQSGKQPKKIYMNDDGDRILFKNFVLDLKYNNMSNRHLLHPLTTLDLTNYSSLMLTGITAENVPSSNTLMYLENFEDLMIDPITKGVMEDCGIPTEYGEALMYANSLLMNYDREISEVSLKNERMPSNTEVIQGAMYRVMAEEWGDYAVKKKRGSRNATFSVQQDAVINLLNTLPNVEESSKVNSIQHVDKSLTISNKGLSGINDDRSYTIKKKRWDKSFYGVMSDVSPYNAKTGVTKHLSVNPNITDVKGYFGSKEAKNATSDEMMSVSEALGPYSQRHDSSPRTAMRMMQANHLMGTEGSEPALVTYGMDESMSSLDSDFAKRLSDDAEVILYNERFLKLRYKNKKKDDGTPEDLVINLDEVDRNAAKAFFIPNKLVINPNIKNFKVGTIIPKNTIIAYNTNFYAQMGEEVVFKSGPIVNVAIMQTQYAYEDSTVISETLAKKLQTKTLKRVAVRLNNRNKIVEARTDLGEVKSGDVLMKFAEDTGSDFLNSVYDTKALEEHLLRVKDSHYNGVIKDIYIYYKLTENEVKGMDSSIKKFIKNVEDMYEAKFENSKVSDNIAEYEKNRIIEHVTRFTDSRKNKVNGDVVDKGDILIEYFIETNQNFSSGDKLTIGNTALKGVASKILPDNKCPVGVESGRRYDLILSTFSPLSRMIYSMFMVGPLTAAIEELNNQILDIVNGKTK